MRSLTPSLALIISSLVPGCGESCRGFEYSEEEMEVEVRVHDLGEWIENDDVSEQDCLTLCNMKEAYFVLECEMSGYAPDNGVDFPSQVQGGAGGEAPSSPISGEITLVCNFDTSPYCDGRRHEGWTRGAGGKGCSEEGAWLGRAASAEAGSIASFRHLARELQECGAPQDLVRRALSAARDEIQHTRVVLEAARAHGGRPEGVGWNRPPRRSLFELALENAREGCVSETFAAVMAAHQSAHAEDKNLAVMMGGIARDETGHAQLAWDLHRWFLSQLNEEECELVQNEVKDAFAQLLQSTVKEEIGNQARRTLGLPDRSQAHSLACGLRERLLEAA